MAETTEALRNLQRIVTKSVDPNRVAEPFGRVYEVLKRMGERD